MSATDDTEENAMTDFAKKTPKLGFGLMRLPKLKDGKSIDIEQTAEMVDLFLDAGFTYFDTAYVYDNGGSEEAARKALIERHDRERFTIATKLNAWLGTPDEASAKAQLDASLSRLGTSYVDFYLLHSLQVDNRETYDRYGLWDFVRKAKEEGKIRHWGFSFHGTPELLDELLDIHTDAEFVQLQINYADWDNPNVASRECYEVARKHGKQIVIMEPVKGGILANPPADVLELFKERGNGAGPVSYAIRFAASLEGIITVLSGMSNVEQMKDNISFMRDFKPLDNDEAEMIKAAQRIITGAEWIQCTGCSYCMKGCPSSIHIPMVIRAINEYKLYKDKEQALRRYSMALVRGGKASECVSCAQCEGACPQHLSIIEHMAEATGLFE